MSRTKQREQAFLLIYESLFDADNADAVAIFDENVEAVGDFAKELYYGVRDNTEAIDALIARYSNGWKLRRIPKVNLSILRLSVYEIKYTEIPPSAAINEAVELAKKYSGSEDAAFINGILGSIVRDND